jgi:transketolase
MERNRLQPTQRRLANAIRALAMDAVEAANSGHPGMPMGMADAATALFTRHLKYDPAHPDWPDRDRFVLSAGHGSMLIYALLHLTGYARPTMDDIRCTARAPATRRISSCRASRRPPARWGRGWRWPSEWRLPSAI